MRNETPLPCRAPHPSYDADEDEPCVCSGSSGSGAPCSAPFAGAGADSPSLENYDPNSKTHTPLLAAMLPSYHMAFTDMEPPLL
jgi:hypothetical protein